MNRQIERAEKEAQNIIDKSEDLKLKFERLTAIKCMDEKISFVILTGIPGVPSFEKTRQFVAFANVARAHFESGTSVEGESYIPKVGTKGSENPSYERN